jgi:predicted Zn-dependent protease
MAYQVRHKGHARGRHLATRALALTIAALIVLQPLVAEAQGLRFIRDAEIEDLLAAYAKPIFRAAGLGSQHIKVRVIQDNSFNAFVLDGRNVFINTGALTEAATPNAVIGVLAHETGHIAGGHMAALRAKIARDSSMAMLMQIMGIGALIAGASSGGSQSGVAGVGTSVLSATPEIAMRSILSYRRVQESSADQAGIRFLTATHQSGRGMLETFRKFADEELMAGLTNLPSYVASHPMARDRIAQLEQLAQESPYFAAADPPELQLRHDLMRAKLIGFLQPPQAVYNRYPTSDNGMPARYARTIATFNGRGLEPALAGIDELIREKPDYAYFWEQKADFLAKRGRHADAAAALRKALSMIPDQTLFQAELGQELLATQDKKVLPEVVKLLQRAVVVDENSDAYRQLATAYYGLGKEGEADLASAQASVIEGRLKDAKGFAKRAQAILPSGSQGWLKADDIINIQQTEAQ